MAAIITEEFRRINARSILADIHSGSYYMGIGQQDEWPESKDDLNSTSPFPKGTLGDLERAKHNLTGLFRVSSINSKLVIPFNELESGLVYKVYDPFDPTCFYTDIQTGARPCYAMFAPNMIFLCIHKTPDADDNQPGMVNNNITASFGLSGLHDYGVVTLDGYTWAFIGTYDSYSLINSVDFVAIDAEITPSENLEVTTYAKAYLALPGDDNDILFTSALPGQTGNFYSVAITEDVGLGVNDFSFTDIDPGDSPNSGYGATIRQLIFKYGPGSTTENLVTYVNGTSQGYVTASESGDGTGLLEDYPETLLTGGGSDLFNIQNATGGAVIGFKVLNGGKNYQAPAEAFDDTLVTLTHTAVLYGVDEFGNEKAPVNIVVDIDIDTTSLDPGIGWDLNANCGSISDIRLAELPTTVADTVPGIINNFRDYKEARLELPNWTQGDGLSDPSQVLDVLVKLAPIAGYGYDKTSELPTWYVGIYADTAKATYTPDTTNFHQITLLKNPVNGEGDVCSREYIQPLNYFELENYTPDPQLQPGWQILQGGKKIGAISHIQTLESNISNISLFTPRYYYYGNYKYGFKSIQESGNISFMSPDGLTTITPAMTPTYFTTNAVEYSGQSLINEGYTMHSGTIMFEDNRGGIARAEGQNEEIKLVIQL